MKLFDRVKFATATSGTGNIAIGPAVEGFLTPALAGAVNGDQVPYFIVDGANFAHGLGTYSTSGPSLTRDAAERRWNGTAMATAKLSLSGSAEVFITQRAADIVTPGLVLIRTQIVTTPVAAVDFTGIDGSFKSYELRAVSDLDFALGLRTSVDNGASFASGAADYLVNFSTVASDGVEGAYTLTSFAFLASRLCVAEIVPGSAGQPFVTLLRGLSLPGGEGWVINGMARRAANGTVNAIRLINTEGGNIASGRFSLFGVQS